MYFIVAANKVYIQCDKEIFESVLETLKFHGFMYYFIEFDNKKYYYYYLKAHVTFIGYKEV